MKQLEEKEMSLKETKKDVENIEKVKQALEADKKELLSSHDASQLRLAETLKSKETLIAELEEKISKLREEALSKDSSSESILAELKSKEEELKTVRDNQKMEQDDMNAKMNEKQH